MVFETRTLFVIALTTMIPGCTGSGFVGLPVIASVNGAASPAGAVGTQVVIAGITFGDVQGNSQVLFTNALGGFSIAAPIAQASDWTNTYIITMVPTGAFSGGGGGQTSGNPSAPPGVTVPPDAPGAPLTPSTVSSSPSHSLPVPVCRDAPV